MVSVSSGAAVGSNNNQCWSQGRCGDDAVIIVRCSCSSAAWASVIGLLSSTEGLVQWAVRDWRLGRGVPSAWLQASPGYFTIVLLIGGRCSSPGHSLAVLHVIMSMALWF